jgi:nucleotide-binding universal stress UspA family protein
MTIMQTILCPTDFSPGTRLAVKYAWEIARRSHGNLILQHVYYVPQPLPYARMYEAPEVVFEQAQVLLKQMEKLRDELLPESGNSRATVEIKLDYGNPAEKIPALANARSVDLIVMSTEGAQDRIERWYNTNTMDVVELTRCPVLIIPSGASYRNFEKIVFAVDYQRNELPNLNFIAQFASLFNQAEIIFLHVRPGHTYTEEAARSLESMYDHFNYGNAAFYNSNAKHPLEAIKTFIREQHADLLVMSTHDRSSLQRLFHPSLTRKVVIAPDLPLLVMHKR